MEIYVSNILIQTSSILKQKKMSSITFTKGELGDESSFKPDRYRGPIQVWTRPTPERTVQNPWKEKFPEQTGINKDGKVVPLKDFDIYDMLSVFLSSKKISEL